MSSYIRNLQRKAARKSAGHEPREQHAVVLRDGGYATLTPTKGWRVFTAKRLWAIKRTAELLAPRGSFA